MRYKISAFYHLYGGSATALGAGGTGGAAWGAGGGGPGSGGQCVITYLGQ